MKQYSRDFIILLLAKVIPLLLYALTVPYFINKIGPNEYGVIVIAFGILNAMTLADSASSYLISQKIGRKFAINGCVDSNNLSSIFTLYLIFTCIIMTIGIVIVYSIQLHYINKLAYIAVLMAFPFSAISNTFVALSQATGLLTFASYSRGAFDIIKSLSLCIAIVFRDLFEMPSLVVAIIILIFSIVRSMVDRQLINYLFKVKIKTVIDRREIMMLLRGKEYLPSFIIVVLSYLVTVGDKFVVAYYYGNEFLSQYSVAYDICSKLFVLMGVVNMIVFPMVLHKSSRKEEHGNIVKVSLLGCLILFIFYYAPLILFSEYLLGLWINPEFAEGSAVVLKIMAVGSVLYLFGNVFENLLYATGKVREILKVYMFSFFAYIIIMIPLLNNIGVLAMPLLYMTFSLLTCFGFYIIYRNGRVLKI